jgi:hypothetical protein
MSLFPVAGSHFYLGGVLNDKNADFVLGDFTSQTWVEVDGWSQAGTIGDAAALISTPLINRGRDAKQKGTSNAGSMQNIFTFNAADPGQLALIAASLPSNKSNYACKIAWNDAAPVSSAVVTVTIAVPGVFTDAAHGLSIGDQVSFATTGALPTGLVAGTTYFVAAAGFAAGAYSVAATSGGSAITTTGTQSGVHTRSSVPVPSQRYFIGLVMNAQETGGAANTIRNLDSTIEINSNIVRFAAIQ